MNCCIVTATTLHTLHVRFLSVCVKYLTRLDLALLPPQCYLLVCYKFGFYLSRVSNTTWLVVALLQPGCYIRYMFVFTSDGVKSVRLVVTLLPPRCNSLNLALFPYIHCVWSYSLHCCYIYHLFDFSRCLLPHSLL